jgi:hypothetical protein
MKLITRAITTAGMLSLAGASVAKADVPDLSGSISGATFTAAATGNLTVTYLFSRALFTNDLILFAAVGGGAIGTNPLIHVIGTWPAVNSTAASATFAVTAGQSLLFGICSSGNLGGAATACASGYSAWYMGSGTDNIDGQIHTAIMSASQWNSMVGSPFGGFAAPPGTTVVGFEDQSLAPNSGSDRDYNDIVFAFSNVQTVPEPSTMGLLALGLVGLSGAGLIRRRSAKRGK